VLLEITANRKVQGPGYRVQGLGLWVHDCVPVDTISELFFEMTVD
jgi:hypothetical protein